ncbi:Probable signal peptidase I LepB [Mycobacteroides abscessus]|nr:Probable signal peptidase I LepB [Mycobacteroides abscessus]
MSYDVYFVRRHPPQDFEHVPENEHPLKESSDLRSRLVADMNAPEVFEGSDGTWELTDPVTTAQVNYAPDGVGMGVSYDSATSDEFDSRIEHLMRLAKIIEDETGLTAWDPQAEKVFGDVTLDDSRQSLGQFETGGDKVEHATATEQTDAEKVPAVDSADEDPAQDSKDASDSDEGGSGMLREVGVLLLIALVLYCITQNFIARPYLIPSESMEPTLHGCRGCTGDRIMVDKVVGGLQGRRAASFRWWRERDLHRPQGELRRWRRAHLPGALAQYRPHRDLDPRCGPSRQAVLPARVAR